MTKCANCGKTKEEHLGENKEFCYFRDRKDLNKITMFVPQEEPKGCGKEFMYIKYLNDKRICGQIEDLKHSENVLLCPSCKSKSEEPKGCGHLFKSHDLPLDGEALCVCGKECPYCGLKHLCPSCKSLSDKPACERFSVTADELNLCDTKQAKSLASVEKKTAGTSKSSDIGRDGRREVAPLGEFESPTADNHNQRGA